jgi:ElaB/YqjD/DUF883 family membrane-anchored ribosome-binding protein
MAKNKTEFTSSNNGGDFASKPSYPSMSSDLASEYPEINEIREDLNSLKDNVFELSRHVKTNSGHHIADVKHYAEDQISRVKRAGADALHKVEGRIADRPGQTIALAFFAGLATSFLLGKRR